MSRQTSDPGADAQDRPLAAPRLAVVVGNPKAGSRTLGLAQRLASDIATRLQAEYSIEVELAPAIDLAEVGAALLDWTSPVLAPLVDRVRSSALMIVASPTYKASYTGLLKLFLDLFGKDSLLGTVTVPVMTGVSDLHALAVEVHLRPVLVELGGPMPTRGLYVVESELTGEACPYEAWLTTALPQIAAAIAPASRKDLHEELH